MSVIPADVAASPGSPTSPGESARVDLPVRGMTCSACATRLEKALGLVDFGDGPRSMRERSDDEFGDDDVDGAADVAEPAAEKGEEEA